MNEAAALAGFANRFTLPSGCTKTPLRTLPLICANPGFCQLVGQLYPLPTLMGNPDVQRVKPETCQPPVNASAIAFMLLPTCRPRPNGRSTTQFALSWCVVS